MTKTDGLTLSKVRVATVRATKGKAKKNAPIRVPQKWLDDYAMANPSAYLSDLHNLCKAAQNPLYVVPNYGETHTAIVCERADGSTIYRYFLILKIEEDGSLTLTHCVRDIKDYGVRLAPATRMNRSVILQGKSTRTYEW